MIHKFIFAVLVFATTSTAILFFFQRRFFYPAPREAIVAAPAGYRFIQLRTSDGLVLRAAYRPATEEKPTLLFFHGNGDSVAGADVATRLLTDAGYGALLVEYRGYADNPGSPSEDGLYIDGQAAITWLSAEGVGPDRLIIMGNSIGSGPATEMALRHQPAALVLISAFASLPTVVSETGPLFALKWLVRDRYDNVSKIGQIKSPVLLLHGTADRIVKPANAAKLASAAPQATLIMIPDAGHEIAYGPASQNAILRWLGMHRLGGDAAAAAAAAQKL